MKCSRRLTVGLSLSAILSACGSSTPTAPSRPTVVTPAPAPSPAPPSAARGEITIREISPGSGATLTVRACDSGNITRICTDQWRGTFEVVMDGGMSNAVLTVSFYNGPTRCGYAADTRDVVTAGSRVLFSPSMIYLSDDYGMPVPPCPFPANTTRMVAELWSDSDNTTLRQEFANVYTFAER